MVHRKSDEKLSVSDASEKKSLKSESNSLKILAISDRKTILLRCVFWYELMRRLFFFYEALFLKTLFFENSL
jgi:hypothetical protein